MLARLQRMITLGLAFVLAGWVSVCIALGHPGWAVAGALVVLCGHGAFLAAEFVMVKIVSDSEGAPRASWHELASAWCGEFVAAPRVFYWRQPFRSEAEPDFLPAHPDGRRGLVLIHGFVCNRGFWNPWMSRLRSSGIPFVAPTLEPVFASISDYASQIEQAVARMEAATGTVPVIVAHSMGGLAVRHWMQTCPARHRLHHIITIGTPHAGTWLARFAHRRPGTEMAMKSDWLRQLGRGHVDTETARYTCFYGNADNAVFPASSGRLPGADNRLIHATAHVELAFHPDVFAEAMRRLADPFPRPADQAA